MRNQTILVDINKETCKILKYKQYDNNNILQIIVEENYKKINLNEYIGFAFFELPSGLIIKKECEIEDNVITIIIDNNILSEDGKVLLDLTLSDGEDTFTLFRINLVIEETIDRDEAIIIEAGWDIVAEIAKFDKAEEQRVDYESVRIANEADRQNEEMKRIANEKVRVVKESDRQNEEMKRIANEKVRVAKEDERLINEIERQTTEELRIENEEGRVQAEASRVTAENIRAEFYEGFNDRLNEVDSQLTHATKKISDLDNEITSTTNINLINYLKSNISINEAFEMAQRDMDKGKIFIPNGEYEITDTIILNKEVYLDFSPKTKIINPFQNKTTIKINSNNVTVDRGYFVGNPNRTDVVYAITVSDSISNVSIINNTIENYNGGIILISENDTIQIDNNNFKNLLYTSESENTAGYGIVLQSSKNCRITNNTFNNVERHHIYMGRNPEKLELTGGNHIISNNTFLGISQTEYFTGNEFLVKIMGNQNVSVTGNTFQGGVGHLWLTSSGTVDYHCENISITGNTFRNLEGQNYSTSCMIGSASDVIDDYLSEVINCTITGNTLINCNSPQAIKFDKISNSIINSNTIKNCKELGINIIKGSLNTTISNNVIDGTTRAIQVAGEGNYKEINIINNLITNATFCLYIDNIEFLYIKSNILKSIKYQPIYLDNCVFTHASITNNDILGGNSGITLASSCSERILIEDNHFYNQTTNRIENLSTALIFKVICINGIRQNIEFYANEKPSVGTFTQGDVCKIINPGEGHNWGYICTSGGSPGTWKGLGLVGSGE